MRRWVQHLQRLVNTLPTAGPVTTSLPDRNMLKPPKMKPWIHSTVVRILRKPRYYARRQSRLRKHRQSELRCSLVGFVFTAKPDCSAHHSAVRTSVRSSASVSIDGHAKADPILTAMQDHQLVTWTDQDDHLGNARFCIVVCCSCPTAPGGPTGTGGIVVDQT